MGLEMSLEIETKSLGSITDYRIRIVIALEED